VVVDSAARTVSVTPDPSFAGGKNGTMPPSETGQLATAQPLSYEASTSAMPPLISPRTEIIYDHDMQQYFAGVLEFGADDDEPAALVEASSTCVGRLSLLPPIALTPMDFALVGSKYSSSPLEGEATFGDFFLEM
jgi:hypothetical protein